MKNETENQTIKIRGREFTKADIEIIKNIIEKNPLKPRLFQSQKICEELHWRQANGILKDRACREVMLRLHNKGLIECPPKRLKPRNKKGNKSKKMKITFAEPAQIKAGYAGDYSEIKFETVRGTEKENLWDYLIERYHYLGYQVMVGHHLKYLIYLDSELCGCTGFSDGVLKLKLRDTWIGWNIDDREKNLHKVINNSRYLILPWIKVKYLSSKILSIIIRQIKNDWKTYYGYSPMLCETFVDKNRFSGISYKAANWIYLGETKGKGRSGMKYHYHGIKKDLYVYPLDKNWRKGLLLK